MWRKSFLVSLLGLLFLFFAAVQPARAIPDFLVVGGEIDIMIGGTFFEGFIITSVSNSVDGHSIATMVSIAGDGSGLESTAFTIGWSMGSFGE